MPFLLNFMAAIHTAYATMKMPGLKGVITIKVDQLDALACKNASLSHVGRFGDKVAQDQATKVAASLARHQRPSHQPAGPHAHL
jgi:hypothetical protein